MKEFYNEYILHDNYAEIVINSPKFGIFNALIDLDDLERCKKQVWSIQRTGKKGCENIFYVVCKNALLHRILMNIDSKNTKLVVDHIDGNTLDNRKKNLRICTRAENSKNNRLHMKNKSGHKGVYWNDHIPTPKWMAYICVDYKVLNLGYYDDYNEAVKIREEAERKYYGEFSRKIEKST